MKASESKEKKKRIWKIKFMLIIAYVGKGIKHTIVLVLYEQYIFY